MTHYHEHLITEAEQCPMLVSGGVRCSNRATVTPPIGELPAYCIPGKAICQYCYESFRKGSSSDSYTPPAEAWKL
jgi:hypothetical protein